MTTFIGCDPGLRGGIAVLDRAGTILAAIPTPVCGRDIDCAGIRDFIAPYAQEDTLHFVVEQVGAFPGQGVCSVFTFGSVFGQVKGMLQTLGIPYTLVRPQSWKKVMLEGTPKDKDAAIAFCRREFPGVNLIPPRCRVPHDGIADALCLAYYGRRMEAR